MPYERRPIPKNRGGARSDRADTGRLPGENAIFSSHRSRGAPFWICDAPLVGGLHNAAH